MTTNLDALQSRNGKLIVGMTQADVAQKATESERAAKKLAKAFEMADGLGDGGIKDGVISEAEIAAYDKEIRKKNIKTGIMIAGGVLLAIGTALAITKGIKAHKAATMLDFDKALKANAKDAFADVVPDNYKGKGVSYLVDAEASATQAYKLKMGKTVGETLELNKEVGLELVQDATGRHKYGVKSPWAGWENLPGWKNEYGSLSFQELKKMYPEITADMYYCPPGPGMIKAYGAQVAENGSIAIQKEYNDVANIAFQTNASKGAKGAKNLVNITHVLDDGSQIKFDKLDDGWHAVKKGQYNPADPENPLPLIQTVVGFNSTRTISTLEGPIQTDIAMTDAGGFPYNKFKDFWKQLTRHKVKVNPDDPNSVKMFEQVKIWEELAAKVESLKASGNLTDVPALEAKMDECQNIVKQIIKNATNI